jgi:nitrogen fixation NifU-like protein
VGRFPELGSGARVTSHRERAGSVYDAVILDHYRNPRHKGLRVPFDAEVYRANSVCGDQITLRVRLDGDTVIDVSYESDGCSVSEASASVMTGLVMGRPVAQATRIAEAFRRLMQPDGPDALDAELVGEPIAHAFTAVGRHRARVKCALLPWAAWKDATAQVVAATPHSCTTAPDQVDHAAESEPTVEAVWQAMRHVVDPERAAHCQVGEHGVPAPRPASPAVARNTAIVSSARRPSGTRNSG